MTIMKITLLASLCLSSAAFAQVAPVTAAPAAPVDAVFSTSRRAISSSMRASAIHSRMLARRASGSPKVTRSSARSPPARSR